MKCSDLIVKILENNKVKYIFGVPGDIETDIAESLRKSKIKFITTRNEKSAAFMADIYARTSKGIGICFSTVGPGATNLMSGLANATSDRSAVIALSDQLPRSEMDLRAHQFIDYDKAFHPSTGITKWNTTLMTGQSTIQSFRQAFRAAYSEFQGAVHIGLPVDILREEIKFNGEEIKFDLPCPSPQLNPTSINEAYQKIKNAKSVIIVGGAVKRTGSQKEFQKFVEKTKFPVLSTFRGKGSLDGQEPLYLGTISRHLQGIFKGIFDQMSSIVCVGYDLTEGVMPSVFGGLEKLINIDVADNRVPGKFEPTQNVFGDLGTIFKELAKRQYSSGKAFDHEEIKNSIRTAIYGDLDMDVYPPRPHKIMEAINKVYGTNSVIVCDVGINKYYAGLLLKVDETGEVIFSNGMSSMAFSSGTLAAKLAKPDKHVLAITGDGGFLMNPQEISTCVRYNIPMTTIVLNNSGLGLVEKKQRQNFGSTYEVKFGSPDYVKFAESFGAKGYSVKSWGQLEDVLNETRDNNKINIIDVPVDYNEGL